MGRGTLGRVFEFTLMLESPAGVPKVNYGYDLAVLIIQASKTKQVLVMSASGYANLRLMVKRTALKKLCLTNGDSWT